MIRETPGNSVKPFDVNDIIALPAPVAAASEAFRDALARMTAVRGELAAKREDLAAARATDASAARAAVASGKTPPTAGATKVADAVDRAERAVPAADQLAQQAQREYLAACAEHFGTLAATLHERQAAVRDEGRSALDALAGALRESIALADLERELQLDAIRSARPMFDPRRQRRRKDPADEILAPVRARLGEHERSGNRFVTGQAA